MCSTPYHGLTPACALADRSVALGLALRELQNIHPCTYVQGVLWYGVKHIAECTEVSQVLKYP